MFEIHYIMRFYFLFRKIIWIRTMIYKFPKTFRFILIYDRYTDWFRSFDFRSFLQVFSCLILFKFISLLMIFSCSVEESRILISFFYSVQESRILSIWRKINITVWFNMIKLKTIIIINVISIMLIGSVRFNLENDLGT